MFVLSQLVEFVNGAKASVEFLDEFTIPPLTVFQEFQVLSYKLANLDVLAGILFTELTFLNSVTSPRHMDEEDIP